MRGLSVTIMSRGAAAVRGWREWCFFVCLLVAVCRVSGGIVSGSVMAASSLPAADKPLQDPCPEFRIANATVRCRLVQSTDGELL